MTTRIVTDCNGRKYVTNEPVLHPREWVGLTQTQVKLLREGVEKESIKTGDSIDWCFYNHINEALKDRNQ